MWSSVVVILSLNFAVVLSSTKSYINIGGFNCPQEENLLGTCLKEIFNNYIPLLSIGMPEFNIPSCEPLLVKSFSVRQAAGPISVNASFSNVQVRGPSTMRIKDVQIDGKNQRLVVDLHIPELKMKGEYKLKGSLVMIPVKANGDFTAKYHDINATVIIKLGRKEISGEADVLSCEKLDVNFQAGGTSMNMKNLFGDDTELTKAMNNFLNENWQSMSGHLKTPIEDALRDFLKPLADHAFATLPADDILQTK